MAESTEIELEELPSNEHTGQSSNDPDSHRSSDADLETNSILNDPTTRKNYERKLTPDIVFTIAGAIFACVSMAIAIIVVCVTHREPAKVCKNIFEPTVKGNITPDSLPRSATLADVNRDGRLDIIVTNFGTSEIGVFIRLADDTFADQRNYFTGRDSQPCSIVAGDFNSDQLVDVVVANFGTHTLGLLLGTPNGTFPTMYTLATGPSRPILVDAADFNNDKLLDVVVIYAGTDDIGVHLNHGDGTFEREIRYFMGFDSNSTSLATGQFNDDGYLDMVVVNKGMDDVAVLFGSANGTFTSAARYSMGAGSRPSWVTVGDMDNDGRPDLVVANTQSHNVVILHGQANGTFNRLRTIDLGITSYPAMVRADNMNGDNYTDIAVIDSTQGYICILLGLTNGSFSNITIYVVVDDSYPVFGVVGQLNEDDRSELVVVNSLANKILVLSGYVSTFSADQDRYVVGRYAHPSALAVVDVNSDQRLDIVIIRPADDAISIALGFGNGSFRDDITYALPTGSGPQGIAVGDLNHDGNVDLIVANYIGYNIGIILGLGNGTFGPMVAYSTGNESFTIFVLVADFNNDTHLDVAGANFRPDSIAILVGYGNGSFAPAVMYSTSEGADPCALVVGDFNGDHRLDLAVANSERGNVGILLGNGDATFRPVMTYSTGFETHPSAIATGLINSDEWLDIGVVDSTSDNMIVLLGQGNGSFGKPISFTHDLFSNPSGLVIVRVDDDSFMDVIVTNFGSDNVAVLSGDGNGSFKLTNSCPLLSGAGPIGIAIGDVDNDSQQDMIVAESGLGSFNVLIWYRSANFKNESSYSTGDGAHPYGVAVADFNHDNHVDITVSNSAHDSVSVLFNRGNGSFAPAQTLSTGLHSHPQGIVVGDFNSDGHIDIASVNTHEDSLALFLGMGNGSFADADKYAFRPSAQPVALAAADFNHDSRWDLAATAHGRDTISIMFGYNYMAFLDQQTYSTNYSQRPTSMVIRDFNGDRHPDVAVAFADNSMVAVYFGDGNGTFAEPVGYALPYQSYPYEIIASYANNDTFIDLIVANIGASTVGVLYGHADGSFGAAKVYSTGYDSKPYSVVDGDLNNDGRTDLVAVHYHSNSIGVVLGYGNGSFSAVMEYTTGAGSRPRSAVIGDFNGDGALDIVVSNYYRDSVALFTGHGDGTFADARFYATGYLSMPTFLSVNDYDNDSRADVAVSNGNNDSVGILYGLGNGTFAPIVFYGTGDGTSPQCIRSGDFDNDGRVDIAAVCQGTNTVVILYGLGSRRFLMGPSQSTGSKSGPASLAIGDLDGNGYLDVVTANYLSDNIGVHLSHGTRLFGGITRCSTGYRSAPFGVAVSDFNADGHADMAVTNKGTRNMGIILGKGDGTFQAMVKYPFSENAVPLALSVADINNDTHVDILVVDTALSRVYVFLGIGDGSFVLQFTSSTGTLSEPFGLVIADMTNDQMPDIVFVTIATSKVIFVQGFGNGTFGNQMSYAMGYKYKPYSVAIGDFDGDNWLDIAVSNYGANYVEVLLRTC